MLALCTEIANENDIDTFHQLIRELNDLLERKERRLEHPDSPWEPK